MKLFILTIALILLLPGCAVNYGTRHFIEDYDVIRFQQTTLYLDGEISRDTDIPGCDRVSAWAGGEHDIAGNPYKVATVGLGCSFSIGE